MTITSKQRVALSLAWQEPDRVPIQIYLTPEIRQKFDERFPGRDILEFFGVDFRNVGPVWRGPVKQGGPGVHYDIWGVGYMMQRNDFGCYPEAVELPLAQLQTMDDVQRYPWPDINDYDFSSMAGQCAQLEQYAVCLGDAGMPDIVNSVGRGRGMEQVLMDVALEDEVGLAIIDKRVEFYLEYLRRGLEAADGTIDIVCIGEDCGNQNGRMVSPRTFETVFQPRIQKYIELGHEFGCKVMMHSCGDTHELQPTFMAMGLDVLDAMQPEPAGMDPETIRAACRGQLAFCGLISTQQTLPYGTVEQCRAEARHRLDVIAPGGGYIFAPAHCIQPDTPLENMVAIFEEALGRRLWEG